MVAWGSGGACCVVGRRMLGACRDGSGTRHRRAFRRACGFGRSSGQQRCRQRRHWRFSRFRRHGWRWSYGRRGWQRHVPVWSIAVGRSPMEHHAQPGHVSAARAFPRSMPAPKTERQGRRAAQAQPGKLVRPEAAVCLDQMLLRASPPRKPKRRATTVATRAPQRARGIRAVALTRPSGRSCWESCVGAGDAPSRRSSQRTDRDGRWCRARGAMRRPAGHRTACRGVCDSTQEAPRGSSGGSSRNPLAPVALASGCGNNVLK